MGQVGRQRHRRHLVGTHRQQATRQAAVEATDVGVAGQHQYLAAHLARGGAGHIALSGLLIGEHLALLENLPAGLLDGRGQALGQF